MQSTPKKKDKKRKSGSIVLSPQFSEIEISPGRSPVQGNLTGLPRKVKDSCADWHNCVQKWNGLNADGIKFVTEISNIKLQAIFDSEQSAANEESAVGEVDMPLGLLSFIEKLKTVVELMEKVVMKMEKVTFGLKGVAELEFHQHNESYCEEPLFQTWSTDKFYECSQELLEMYQKELPLKRTILQNVAHANQRDLLMVYTAAWRHEPYISDKGMFLLESMLKETGHK